MGAPIISKLVFFKDTSSETCVTQLRVEHRKMPAFFIVNWEGQIQLNYGDLVAIIHVHKRSTSIHDDCSHEVSHRNSNGHFLLQKLYCHNEIQAFLRGNQFMGPLITVYRLWYQVSARRPSSKWQSWYFFFQICHWLWKILLSKQLHSVFIWRQCLRDHWVYSSGTNTAIRLSQSRLCWTRNWSW